MPGNRDKSCRFLPGASGNPSGRPETPEEFKKLAQAHSVEAFIRLVAHMRLKNPAVSIPAAKAILDRAYGRPLQQLVSDGSLVNINVGNGPIITADDAARAYQALCRDPAASLEGITSAAPAPSAALDQIAAIDTASDGESS